MNYAPMTENNNIGGSMKEPLLEAVEGVMGQIISPGDKIVTFTQVYGRGTRIYSGIYRGVIRSQHWIYYVVEREDGKRSKLNYNGMVLPHTTLADLDDKVI